ncbi:hypothetical protein COSO111634_09190 [Corallococcus soli]
MAADRRCLRAGGSTLERACRGRDARKAPRWAMPRDASVSILPPSGDRAHAMSWAPVDAAREGDGP